MKKGLRKLHKFTFNLLMCVLLSSGTLLSYAADTNFSAFSSPFVAVDTFYTCSFPATASEEIQNNLLPSIGNPESFIIMDSHPNNLTGTSYDFQSYYTVNTTLPQFLGYTVKGNGVGGFANNIFLSDDVYYSFSFDLEFGVGNQIVAQPSSLYFAFIEGKGLSDDGLTQDFRVGNVYAFKSAAQSPITSTRTRYNFVINANSAQNIKNFAFFGILIDGIPTSTPGNKTVRCFYYNFRFEVITEAQFLAKQISEGTPALSRTINQFDKLLNGDSDTSGVNEMDEDLLAFVDSHSPDIINDLSTDNIVAWIKSKDFSFFSDWFDAFFNLNGQINPWYLVISLAFVFAAIRIVL